MTDQEAINIVRGQAQMISSIDKAKMDPMTRVMVEAMMIVVGLAQERMQDLAVRAMLKKAGVKDENTKTD